LEGDDLKHSAAAIGDCENPNEHIFIKSCRDSLSYKKIGICYHVKSDQLIRFTRTEESSKLSIKYPSPFFGASFNLFADGCTACKQAEGSFRLNGGQNEHNSIFSLTDKKCGAVSTKLHEEKITFKK